MRIVSLLPSATEIVYALGMGDSLVGVTHECDYPQAARSLPRLTASLLPEGMSSAEIDAAVSASLRDVHTLYSLDTRLLSELDPDIVLTQSLCEVCAVPRAEVEDAVCTMPRAAQVLSLDPSSLEDVLGDIERVAAALGCPERGVEVVASLLARLDAVSQRVSRASARPRVFCAEWLDPIFCDGHWIPGMVAAAGGDEGLGRPEIDSARIDWQVVVDWAPEVLVMMPCGFDAYGALNEAHAMTARPGWETLPAVQAGRAYVVDGNAYFARPGPRLIDGVEILARLLHPDLFKASLAPGIAFALQPGTTDSFTSFV